MKTTEAAEERAYARDIDHLAGFLAAKGLPFRLSRKGGLRRLEYACPLLGEKVLFEEEEGSRVVTREVEVQF